jgi:hypothetical protein
MLERNTNTGVQARDRRRQPQLTRANQGTLPSRAAAGMGVGLGCVGVAALTQDPSGCGVCSISHRKRSGSIHNSCCLVKAGAFVQASRVCCLHYLLISRLNSPGPARAITDLAWTRRSFAHRPSWLTVITKRTGASPRQRRFWHPMRTTYLTGTPAQIHPSERVSCRRRRRHHPTLPVPVHLAAAGPLCVSRRSAHAIASFSSWSSYNAWPPQSTCTGCPQTDTW